MIDIIDRIAFPIFICSVNLLALIYVIVYFIINDKITKKCKEFNKNFFDFCYTCFSLNNDSVYPEFAGSEDEKNCKLLIASCHNINQSSTDFFSVKGTHYVFSLEREVFGIDEKYLKVGFGALLEEHVNHPVTILKTKRDTGDSIRYTIDFILK